MTRVPSEFRAIEADEFKLDADPVFSAPDDVAVLTPNNVAVLTYVLGQNTQRDLVRVADGVCNLEPCAHRGQIANYAINSGTIEFNRSGFKDTLSLWCTSLIHTPRN